MFVCHGNICRSPMAEFIFKDLVAQRGYTHEIFISSSATSTEEIYCGIGNPIYPPALSELARHGIYPIDKRAIQLKRSDGEDYNMLIGMDAANIRNMYAILGEDKRNKVYKLMEFTGSTRDVADPWYSDRFDVAFSDIYEGCCALLQYLENNKIIG